MYVKAGVYIRILETPCRSQRSGGTDVEMTDSLATENIKDFTAVWMDGSIRESRGFMVGFSKNWLYFILIFFLSVYHPLFLGLYPNNVSAMKRLIAT